MGLFDDEDEKPSGKEKKEPKKYTMKEIKDLFKIFKDATSK